MNTRILLIHSIADAKKGVCSHTIEDQSGEYSQVFEHDVRNDHYFPSKASGNIICEGDILRENNCIAFRTKMTWAEGIQTDCDFEDWKT